jgi:acyl-homoserine-lactone acylase
LGNPHYPWTSTDRFYQVHLTVPGKYDAMGVILGGLPMVVIGFNKDVAWTHTVTKALHFTTFKLALDQSDPSGTTYLVDGIPERMTAKAVDITIRQPDGTIRTKSKTFYFARQGALMLKPEAGLSWTASTAYALGDPNRNNTRLLEQWLEVGQASSVQSMRDVLSTTVGLPWINTVAADRAGNAMYIDASVVPHVTTEQFTSNCMVFPALLMLDGSRGACAWGRDPGAPTGIFSPVNAPIQIRTDYVGNSNDSYWLSNPSALLTGPPPWGYSPLYGQVGVEQSLRTRIGFLQMEEAVKQKKQLQADDLQELLFANRIYAAELVLPDLLAACAGTDDVLLRRACDALSRWDRHANLDSRGALLFREFWNLAAGIPDKWRVPLNKADPVTTPYGLKLAVVGQMLAALKSAANQLQSLGIPFDSRLGDFQGDTRNGVRVPIHGGIGDIDGAYNSIHMRSGLDAAGYHDIAWGTSYIQIVGFDEAGPVARGLLVYGQSTDPRSPYYADQVPLYSEKTLQPLPFSAQQMMADPGYQLMRLQE